MVSNIRMGRRYPQSAPKRIVTIAENRGLAPNAGWTQGRRETSWPGYTAAGGRGVLCLENQKFRNAHVFTFMTTRPPVLISENRRIDDGLEIRGSDSVVFRPGQCVRSPG